MSFGNFPAFSKLSWADREEYEEFIKDYPPVADISFAGLMGWWGLYESPEISLLNGNMVIRYFNDDLSSELCLVGTNEIDQSCCTIFDYLKDKGQIVRLAHVPDFVIDNMQYPELFNFRGERSYDEYVVELSRFYPLEKSNIFQRRRVAQFIERTGGNRLYVGSLDLNKAENQQMLLEAINKWPNKGINNLSQRENAALKNAILNAGKLDLHNTCLTINGELHGFLLFQAPHDKTFITLEHVRASYALPYLIHFMTFIFSEWFVKQDVHNVNVCMDYGKPALRVAKLALRPVNFFRKYTVAPQHEMSPANLQAQLKSR